MQEWTNNNKHKTTDIISRWRTTNQRRLTQPTARLAAGDLQDLIMDDAEAAAAYMDEEDFPLAGR